MHINVIIPIQNVDKGGIKLASGHMRRTVQKNEVSFYKPLTVQDGFCDLNGILDSDAIRKFISTKLPNGSIFVINDDSSDPFRTVIDLKREELAKVTFIINKAYRLSA